MATWNQERFISAWRFASEVHNGQLVPGTTLPYINHIANVAMEVMCAIAVNSAIRQPDLSVQCALLHDTIEDTDVTYETLEKLFGNEVASGVLALTKNPALPSKEAQMEDSLARIKAQPVEIWMVKLADRITNLQPPPSHWDKAKTNQYRNEAKRILDELGSSNAFLTTRLLERIEAYADYC